MAGPSTPFSLLLPPYRELIPLDQPSGFFQGRDLLKGTALVWELARGWGGEHRATARSRTPGVALMAILPPATAIPRGLDLLSTLEETRPHTVLPHHPRPASEELSGLLKRAPADLSIQVTDFLVWRGLEIDRETRHIIRRTVDLAGELTTVAGLARSVYLSRRALGRRFMTRSLPVPSHWLQFARVLRASILLQSTSDTLFEVGCGLGYPDGFALSNQMKRLVGIRPSEARSCLGWEWVVEAWLRREAAAGRLGEAPSKDLPARAVDEPAARRPEALRARARGRRSPART